MPSGAAKFERLKVDDNDQDDSGFLDFASLERSDHSVNISPESIGAKRINDQTPSPTTAMYSLPVQTPTSKDPGENHFGKSVLFTKILVYILILLQSPNMIKQLNSQL